MAPQSEIIEFCKNAQESPIGDFCRLREELHNRFFKGLIFSTTHGADIFKNVLNCLNGQVWKEEGEYGNNFRKGINLYL
jgi:hypothetical protein